MLAFSFKCNRTQEFINACSQRKMHRDEDVIQFRAMYLYNEGKGSVTGLISEWLGQTNNTEYQEEIIPESVVETKVEDTSVDEVEIMQATYKSEEEEGEVEEEGVDLEYVPIPEEDEEEGDGHDLDLEDDEDDLVEEDDDDEGEDDDDDVGEGEQEEEGPSIPSGESSPKFKRPKSVKLGIPRNSNGGGRGKKKTYKCNFK